MLFVKGSPAGPIGRLVRFPIPTFGEFLFCRGTLLRYVLFAKGSPAVPSGSLTYFWGAPFLKGNLTKGMKGSPAGPSAIAVTLT